MSDQSTPASGGEEMYEGTTPDAEFVQPDGTDQELGDRIEGSVDELADNNEADGNDPSGDRSEHADAEPEGERPDQFEPPSTDSIEGTKLAQDSADLLQGRTPTHPE